MSPLEAAILSSRGMTAGDARPMAQLLDTPLKDLDVGAKRLVTASQRKEALVVVDASEWRSLMT